MVPVDFLFKGGRWGWGGGGGVAGFLRRSLCFD